MILPRFGSGCFSGRNNPDYGFSESAAMTDHKQICPMTVSENNKSFLLLGMLGIVNDQCFRIIKHRFCLFKSNAMLFLINYVFVLIPFKSHPIHNYIIIII